MSAPIKILHFSPVKKSPEIVDLHCRSLTDLQTKNFDLTFSFFDDNIDPKSTIELQKIKKTFPTTRIFSESDLTLPKHGESKRRWTRDDYTRIIRIKDFVIQYFLKSDFDFLFLTDADLVLHPETLQILYACKKDFVSQVFWTHFSGRPTYFPNAWYDEKNGYANMEQLVALRDEPLLEVDYTGACTLLSRKILESGVRFEKVKNLSRMFLGEDKHFCVRAHVNNFQIFLNTEAPAFHIYNDTLIKTAQTFISREYNLAYLNIDWLNKDWEQKLKTYFEKMELSYGSKLKNKLKNIINS